MKNREDYRMKYRSNHLRRLYDETRTRCINLLATLRVPTTYEHDFTTVDSDQIRVAVDDFESVLSEIRRLK